MNIRTLNTNITKVKFQNSHVVYENFIKCSIKDYEFNLSYNPTLLSGSQAILYPFSDTGSVFYNITGSKYFGILKDFVTGSISGSEFSPYVTAVGLYNDAQELLAIAKLSAPMPISSNSDMTFLVKYDTQWTPKPYFTPTPTPTPSPDCILQGNAVLFIPPSPSASPSSTPTATPSISVTPSVTPSTSINNTPSVTPSISVTPTISVTPSLTPSVTPSVSTTVIRLDWNVNGISGGRLQVNDALGNNVVDESTSTPGNGTVYFTAPETPYSITGSWTGGSGNIIRYRVCNLTVSPSTEMFYSGDIDNFVGSVTYLVDPTPTHVSVNLTSGGSSYPPNCPI